MHQWLLNMMEDCALNVDLGPFQFEPFSGFERVVVAIAVRFHTSQPLWDNQAAGSERGLAWQVYVSFVLH